MPLICTVFGQPMAHFFVRNRAQGPRSAAGRRSVAMATLKIVAFIAKSNVSITDPGWNQ